MQCYIHLATSVIMMPFLHCLLPYLLWRPKQLEVGTVPLRPLPFLLFLPSPTIKRTFVMSRLYLMRTRNFRGINSRLFLLGPKENQLKSNIVFCWLRQVTFRSSGGNAILLYLPVVWDTLSLVVRLVFTATGNQCRPCFTLGEDYDSLPHLWYCQGI